jgi:hypothetical protein
LDAVRWRRFRRRRNSLSSGAIIHYAVSDRALLMMTGMNVVFQTGRNVENLTNPL